MKKNKKIWKNSDNAQYYEAIPIETLKEYAKKGGFEDGCDIDIFYESIENKQSILEVGAGYGRVLKSLLSRGYAGELFAVERSKNLYNHLNQNFADRAEIFCADINNFQPAHKFEAILWMWSNISEFPKDEQLQMLRKLTSWMTNNGVFILDTISHEVTLADDFLMDNQGYVNKTSFGTAYGYIPSTEEIDNYACQLGFDYIEHIDYKTTTNRPRTIHILKKYVG